MSNLFYREPIIRIVKADRGTGKTKSLETIAAQTQGEILVVSDYTTITEELKRVGISHTFITRFDLHTLRGKYHPPSVILVDELRDLNFIDKVIETSFYGGIVYVAYTPVNDNHVYTGRYKTVTTNLIREFTEEQEELLDEVIQVGWFNFRRKYLINGE